MPANLSNYGTKDFRAVTPSDSAGWAGTIDDPLPRAIRADTSGVVKAVRADDTVVTFNVVAGEVLDISPKRINSTGTTATVQAFF